MFSFLAYRVTFFFCQSYHSLQIKSDKKSQSQRSAAVYIHEVDSVTLKESFKIRGKSHEINKVKFSTKTAFNHKVLFQPFQYIQLD